MAGDASRQNGKKGGRKPGVKNFETLRREEVLRDLQQRTMQGINQLYDRMLHNALGHSYLYKIEKYYEKVTDAKGVQRKVLKAKPPKLVTVEYEIRDYLTELVDKNNAGSGGGDIDDPEDTYYFITTDKPSTQAIEKLWNRTFGNSVQPVAILDPHGQSVFSPNDKEKTDKAIQKHLKRG